LIMLLIWSAGSQQRCRPASSDCYCQRTNAHAKRLSHKISLYLRYLDAKA
jgi:hypothetical protein